MGDYSQALSSLTVAIVGWATRLGAADLASTPGLWERTTEPFGDYGPLLVRVNGHSGQEIDAIPPFHFVVQPEGNPLAFMVMVNPYRGMVFNGLPGLEDHLIEHFNSLGSQT